ncbi:hypothetical protein MLD38_026644 [Melastoma candidum]|uniref:Uncharacterized protein n=1 Tax=Melastoma candidum TaxID=119954 RepID=A0ACB9NZR0_9MYRT|nr:hypothetical protein MLD38_026644 [Melastoma candidum]
MDSATTRPRPSSPGNRFLSSYPSPPVPSSSSPFELSEADVCFSSDFPLPTSDPRRYPTAGILSILPSSKGIVVPSVPRKVLLALPRPSPPEREYSKSVPNGARFPRSDPVRVPLAGLSQGGRRRRGPGDDEDDMGYGEEDDMLPPHEMTARGSRKVTCCSVLEGAGRTLKGRDLRQVRNAIWKQTGFLDAVE